MAMTLDDLRRVFGCSDKLPETREEVIQWIAGKAGNWINQNSHVDEEIAKAKAVDLLNVWFANWMLEECMPEGKFDTEQATNLADVVYRLLAIHFHGDDPDNLPI